MAKKLYEIEADYENREPPHQLQYVVADDAEQARATYEGIVSWLQVYDVHEVEDADKAGKIVRNRNQIVYCRSDWPKQEKKKKPE